MNYYGFLLILTSGASLAMTINAFARTGGLGGVRLGIFTLFGGATLVSLGMVGPMGAQSAEEALPWVAVVRVGVGLIGAGFTGLGFLLTRPDARWTRNVTLASAALLPPIGVAVALLAGPGGLSQSEVSWFPAHPLLRLYDTSMIFGGTIFFCAGAFIRWRMSRHGRTAMITLLWMQLGASLLYVLVRAFGGATALHVASPVLISLLAVAYWFTFERWRVAGIGDSGLALVFSRMPLPAVLLDLQTGRCHANPPALATVGDAESVEGMMAVLGLEGDPGDVLAAHDGRTLVAVRLETAPGRLFDVSCHFDAGMAIGLWVLADVTERVQHAAKLGATVSELRAVQDRLVEQEKVAALGVLVAGVNHEINNPLAYASANLRTMGEYLEALVRVRPLVIDHLEGRPGADAALRAWAEDEEVADACTDAPSALSEALQGCAQIREIVASMRMLSRQQGESQVCDLYELAAAGLKIGGTNVSPSIDLKAELERNAFVRAVPGELMRVVTNLVVNAGQALGREGTVRVRTWRDEAAREGVLEVADDGPGIPAHLHSRVFDAFFTTKAPGKGTGLGLAISAETARRHGGTLRLLPSPQGAVFQLRLPLVEAEPESLDAAPSAAGEVATTTPGGGRAAA